MHIPDGILPLYVNAGGFALTVPVAWYTMKKIKQKEESFEHIPKTALMTAVFIVATLISIPIPPVTVHFMLTGLMGVLLGYYAFPAVLVALFFQAVLFQHGGITTLGVNALSLGLPALVASFLYRTSASMFKPGKPFLAVTGFVSGFTGTALSVTLFYTVLVSFIPAHIDAVMEKKALLTIALAHTPLMVVEGLFTSLLLLFFFKVKPEMLRGLRP